MKEVLVRTTPKGSFTLVVSDNSANIQTTTFSPPLYLQTTIFSPPLYLQTTFSPPLYLQTTFSPPLYLQTTFSPPLYLQTTFSPPLYLQTTTFSPPLYLQTTFSPPLYLQTTISPPLYLQTTFSPPLYLQANRDYELAMVNLETYCSFANTPKGNNSFKWSVDEGKSWALLHIPTGCYELKAINAEITRIRGNSDIKILPNVNTLQCKLTVVGAKVSFDVPNSLASVFGFKRV